MRPVKKLIILFSLLAVVSTISAEEFENKEESEVAMILLAQEKMVLAVADLDKTLDECTVKRKKNVTTHPVIPETVLIGNPAFNRPKPWIPDKDIRG